MRNCGLRKIELSSLGKIDKRCSENSIARTTSQSSASLFINVMHFGGTKNFSLEIISDLICCLMGHHLTVGKANMTSNSCPLTLLLSVSGISMSTLETSPGWPGAILVKYSKIGHLG